jgi:uncharacterized protein with HEPN domain
MPSTPSEIEQSALRDMLHHIDLAVRFAQGFDRGSFQDDTRTVMP